MGKQHHIHRVKIQKSILKKYAIFIFLFFAVLVVFLYSIQPIDIYNMESQINKAMIILLLSINFAFAISFELIFLNVHKLTKSRQLINTHIIFSGIIVIASMLILYVRHPFMTKHHFFHYLTATTVIVSVFQLLVFSFSIKKFQIGNNIIENTNTNRRIHISDNKTALSIDSNNLIFIRSEGNYVTIFEKNKKYLIRSSLKKIIEQNGNSGLIRCHKSYIVNINKIKSVSGNSRGYKISLLDSDFEIPVSITVGENLKRVIM